MAKIICKAVLVWLFFMVGTASANPVAIVLTEEFQTKAAIEKQLAAHPDLKLRRIYMHAIPGYSVEGPSEAIEKITGAKLVSPVQSYKVEKQLTGNIDWIGGNIVRGYFDENGQRLTGKGMKVGVIDTGVDYEHPDLHRNYRGGHDLVDEDDDPMETKGTHGMGTLHGTHVAGVIAANGRMLGVAPDAEIIAYRALGPGGMGTTEQVLAAIDKAIEDKVDILNLSLGNEINGPDLPISLAINKAVEKGIVAVTSSGNSGPNKWTVGSPGTASKAISVGASTPPLNIPYLSLSNKQANIRLEPLMGSEKWRFDRSLEIVDGGLGQKNELTGAKGKLVLLKRGKLTFTEKSRNAYEAGATGVIIYNNTDGGFLGNLDERLEIPVASITLAEGKRMKKAMKQGKLYARMELIEEKDILADFSSRGPVTVTWEIKPDVVAPGVAIESTVPGGYLSLQGTSMAAPHVAGASALIKQAHPDWSPEQIKAALMNTAVSIKDRNGHEYRTYEQGAGRIQIEKAVRAETLVLPSSLHFGKFRLKDRLHRHSAVIEVQNHSEKTKRYSFAIPKQAKGINWELPIGFELKPGEKKKVNISMIVDPAAFKQKLHDGFLILNDGTSKMSIPYLYVLEEPDYPRVMGFALAPADKPGYYRYEVYLPGGAEEFGIALFDPDDHRFIRFLDHKTNVKKGLLEQEIAPEDLPPAGGYLAKVFAKKAGQEDRVDTSVFIIPNEG
ncbi:S8 family serine peptidase [Bacillus sp. B15-48]|uniref:S8 family serine peptidase n=1 Tax=Bacillus sp. B15-48 TaxID=1548601 RepID=UPI00193FC580|nr:S8 family serine peptidase [Bacillus sp. B15-48]MBM4761538.1 S8 family serine peptidase [Bacillus sp. B15-48]